MIQLFKSKQSTTLFFCSIGWFILTLKFAFAGAELPLFGAIPGMTGSEYGSALALVLAPWIAREWKEKSK
jgi:hypothetical protein